MSFAYPSHPEKLTIQSANFVFPAGEMAFIVGHSGSGKSTLASLLARFYAPTCGEIMIDGYPIEVLHSNWIRDNVALVHQQSTLFDETIFRNIAFGCLEHEGITEKHIQESIDMAMLRSTIENLPNKLDTVVTSQGNTLSGGQKQRIAIARARLRDAPVLVLDECTSALDYTTRKHVMTSIRHWRKGKTTIVITHDLSQISDSDFVYVLEHGRVVFSGYKPKLHIFTSAEEQEEGATARLDPLDKKHDISEELATPFTREEVLKSKISGHIIEPDEVACHKGEYHSLSMSEIILGIPTYLTAYQRLILVLALLGTLVHAIATPVFAYLLSRLLQTFYADSRHSENAMKWSIAILVVGICDTTASYLMHYMLDYSAQMWIDCIRKVALSRIMDQPLSWFEQTENDPSALATNLNQDAENTRNLVGKFLGFILLVAVIISIASIWSGYVCWELTLVIFACAPFIHEITSRFDKVSKEWEDRCDIIKECSSSIFADTFSRIQTVKALALGSYFRTKHMKASAKAVKIGIRRAVYSGLLFGLVDSMVLLISGMHATPDQ